MTIFPNCSYSEGPRCSLKRNSLFESCAFDTRPYFSCPRPMLHFNYENTKGDLLVMVYLYRKGYAVAWYWPVAKPPPSHSLTHARHIGQRIRRAKLTVRDKDSLINKGKTKPKKTQVMQKQSPITSQQQTDVRPVSEQQLLWKDYSSPIFIADHNIAWYGISLWSVGVNCAGCVPSKPLVHPRAYSLGGQSQKWRMLCKHPSAIAKISACYHCFSHKFKIQQHAGCSFPSRPGTGYRQSFPMTDS